MWSFAHRRAARAGRSLRRERARAVRPDWQDVALEDRLLLTVTNETTHATFPTIQAAITAAGTGDTLQIDNATGNYAEAVTVNKSVTLAGTGNPTVTAPSGSNQPIFHVTAPNVTIQGLNIVVNRPNAAAGIYADQSLGDNFDGLKVLNDTIESTGNGSSLSTGSGNTPAAAIALLNGGNTVPVVTITGNTIKNDGSADFFSMGLWLRQVEATVGGSAAGAGNTITASTQDLLDQLASANGTDHNVIQGNTFGGAGVSLSTPNAGTVDITGNTFSPNSAQYTQSLGIQHNFNTNANVNVAQNTFTGFGKVGVFSGGSQNVKVTGNTFTPAPGTASAPTNADDILVDSSYTPDSGTSPSPLATNAIVVQGNTFNPATNDAGRALDFQNNNGAAGSGFGTITVGGTGTQANVFNRGISQFIRLAPSQLAPDTEPTVSPGPFKFGIDASNNTFDVGTGAKTPATMSATDLFALEDKIVHAVDDPALGFVTVVANTAYVTANSFFAPVTTAPDINNAVAAIASGGTVNVGPGTFATQVNLSKTISLLGFQTGKDPSTRSGAPGTESILAVPGGALNLSASNIVVNGFTIQGTTASTPLGAGIVTQASSSGYSILNNIIQNNVLGLSLANNGTTQTKVQHNLFSSNNQAGTNSGIGILTSPGLQNTLIDSNTFTGQATAGLDVAGGVTGLTVTSNTFLNNTSRGLYVTIPTGGTANSNVKVNFNRFFGNPTAGLEIATNAYTGTLDATDNYWGSNAGPNQTGNDKAVGGPNTSTWLVLGLTTGGSAIGNGGTSKLTADLTKDNKGTDTSSLGHIADGTPIAFSAANGTVNPVTATTVSGKAQSTFTATSTASGTATAALDNQSVNAAVTVQTGTISPTSLPFTDVNVTYYQTITASGGAGGFTYSVSSGTLPAGIALNSTSGVLAGVPTAVGTSTFTVQAMDTSGGTISQSYTLTINPTLKLPAPQLPGATTGSGYNFQFSPQGGTAPYTFSVVSGLLPPGVTLTSGGQLSGTPTIPGTYPFTVQVADSAAGLVTASNVVPAGTWVQVPVAITVTGSGAVATAPTVVTLVRHGTAARRSTLVLTFSEDMNAFTAQNVANYQLTQLEGGRHHRTVGVVAGIYDPTTRSVTLYPAGRFPIGGRYQLVVNGKSPNGVANVNGTLLAGAGKSGTDYVKTFGREILARAGTTS